MSPINNLLGFASYPLPNGQSFDAMQLSVKVQKIVFAIFYAASALFATAIIPSSLPIGLGATVLFCALAARSVLAIVGAFYRAPPMQDLIPKELEAALSPLAALSDKPCKGFATRDGIESHEWKLKLIQAAKQTIFLSGCYCGGRAFDEALDLMMERMRLLPLLRISILCSDVFPTEENKSRLKAMENEFGDRLLCVMTPEIHPYLSPTTDEVFLTTHHTKALVIDYGAAFVVGGSGMVSPWTEQQGKETPTQVESHGIFYDYLLKIKAFKDMDFVFQSPEKNGLGARLYAEMIKLFERFRNRGSSQPLQLLYAPLEPIEMPRQIVDLKLACYTAGPEQPCPQFLTEIIHQVQNAEESIWIGHMYFHPPPKLLQALIDAANRGVKITLLTVQESDQSPGTHSAYAELSRYYAQSLFEGREKPNVEIYEYSVPFTTYHKKAMVFDRNTTLLGSSNIGDKSLGGCDYEIDFKVESAEFAESVIQIIESDKQFSVRNISPHISIRTKIYSTVQSLFTQFL